MHAGIHTHPPPGSRHPGSRQHPPVADRPQQMATAADGMHSTGMHSCISNGCLLVKNRLKLIKGK